mgnify:CR=1 FL=1|tara:strand:- start:418 stop:579 length:162 start_codon:yes stop_codon:yes gene_type:complete
MDYTSPNPDFDAYMKQYRKDKDKLTPTERIERLKQGVIKHKAKKKTINNVNTA